MIASPTAWPCQTIGTQQFLPSASDGKNPILEVTQSSERVT